MNKVLHSTELVDDSGRAMYRFMVDTHAHFHACYDVADYISAAVANARQTADAVPCLMLADFGGQNSIDLIGERLASAKSEFTLHPLTGEAATVKIEEQLVAVLIRGQQVKSLERLEVLVFGASGYLEDDQPFTDTLVEVSTHGKLGVVPWGFGKWSGGRRRLIRHAVTRVLANSEVQCVIAIGDNACRPAMCGRSGVVRNTIACSLRVLPGSDPLPIRGDGSRICSLGMLVSVPCTDRDATIPAQVLRAVTSDEVVTVGRHVSFGRFMHQQYNIHCQGASAS